MLRKPFKKDKPIKISIFPQIYRLFNKILCDYKILCILYHTKLYYKKIKVKYCEHKINVIIFTGENNFLFTKYFEIQTNQIYITKQTMLS